MAELRIRAISAKKTALRGVKILRRMKYKILVDNKISIKISTGVHIRIIPLLSGLPEYCFRFVRNRLLEMMLLEAYLIYTVV